MVGTWQGDPHAQENQKAGEAATAGHRKEPPRFTLARGPCGSSAQAQADLKHPFAWSLSEGQTLAFRNRSPVHCGQGMTEVLGSAEQLHGKGVLRARKDPRTHPVQPAMQRFESQYGTQARCGLQLDATGLPIEEMLACCTDFLICKVGQMTRLLQRITVGLEGVHISYLARRRYSTGSCYC